MRQTLRCQCPCRRRRSTGEGKHSKSGRTTAAIHLRPVLQEGLHITPCTSLGGTPGGLASTSLAGDPGAGCPGGAPRTAWGSPSRPSTAASDQGRPDQIRRRHVAASPERSSQALTRARLKQPAAGSTSRLSLCPGPQAAQQQHHSMHDSWKDLPQAPNDLAQRNIAERPHSAPELSAAQEECLTHPEGGFQAASGLSTPAGKHTIDDLQPKVHLRRLADSRAPSGRRLLPTHDKKAEAQEPERVVYVQRPHAQDLPRRPGSVPDFGKLHLAWSARLAAAKAAMQRRLTVPQVHSLRPQHLGYLQSNYGLQTSRTSLVK